MYNSNKPCEKIRKWTWLSECSSLWSGAVRNHKWSCLSWCIDPLNSILLTLERHNNNMWFNEGEKCNNSDRKFHDFLFFLSDIPFVFIGNNLPVIYDLNKDKYNKEWGRFNYFSCFFCNTLTGFRFHSIVR